MFNSPTPQVMQTFMAELTGWTDLEVRDGILLGYDPNHTGSFVPCPNWLGSHDVARGLEVKDREIFVYCLHAIIFGYRLAYPYNISPYLLFATPLQWCLAWILYKGYRWDDKALEFKPVK